MASEPQPQVAAVLNWRRELQSQSGASRAARARLRRASSVIEALMLEETLDLIKAARQAGARGSGDFEQRLVVLAMTLARVEGESGAPLARVLGQTSNDDRPRLSPARFGGLLRAARARNWDAFARALRRAMAILGDTRFDVARLVRDVLDLDDATLRRWAYDYWQTSAPADPESSQPAASELEIAP